MPAADCAFFANARRGELGLTRSQMISLERELEQTKRCAAVRCQPIVCCHTRAGAVAPAQMDSTLLQKPAHTDPDFRRPTPWTHSCPASRQLRNSEKRAEQAHYDYRAGRVAAGRDTSYGMWD